MNRTMKRGLSVAMVLVLYCGVAIGGEEIPAEEQQLVGVLRSDVSLQEKDAARKQLKRIGSARSVCGERTASPSGYGTTSIPTAGSACISKLST